MVVVICCKWFLLKINRNGSVVLEINFDNGFYEYKVDYYVFVCVVCL